MEMGAGLVYLRETQSKVQIGTGRVLMQRHLTWGYKGGMAAGLTSPWILFIPYNEVTAPHPGFTHALEVSFKF